MIILLNKGLEKFTNLSAGNAEALKKGGYSVNFAADARAHEETNQAAEYLMHSGMWNNTLSLK